MINKKHINYVMLLRFYRTVQVPGEPTPVEHLNSKSGWLGPCDLPRDDGGFKRYFCSKPPLPVHPTYYSF